MIITVDNIGKTYNKKIFDKISFDWSVGQYKYIKGASGCGKTTILNIISNTIQKYDGSVRLNGKDIRDIKGYTGGILGYMPCGNSLIESLNIYDNIKIKSKITDIDIDELFETLLITNIKNKYPREISSGEYKRACLARVIALDTEFIVLDEPTSNLDNYNANIIINYIRNNIKDKGILVATHDDRLMIGEEISI